MQFLAVAALVDGSVRAERIDALGRYSATPGLHEDYLDELIAAGEGRLQWVIADMSRRNVVSISDGRLRPDDFALWPYREAPDPSLADRSAGSASCPVGTRPTTLRSLASPTPSTKPPPVRTIRRIS